MKTALRWPVLLAWLAVALEGYDLVVLGAILPTLSADWGLSGNDGSLLSTVGLVGVAIGAVAVGTASDRFGRRPTLLACVASFSVLTVLCTVVPGFGALLVLRFLAGLGLGGCLPVALTLAAEYARPGSSGASVTRLMTGYHVGAVVTALLAIPIVEDHGWRPMFLIGGVLGLVALPLMWARCGDLRLQRAGARLRVRQPALPATGARDRDRLRQRRGEDRSHRRPGRRRIPCHANREYPWGFYLFAAVASLGALAISVVPPVRATVEVEASRADAGADR